MNIRSGDITIEITRKEAVHLLRTLEFVENMMPAIVTRTHHTPTPGCVDITAESVRVLEPLRNGLRETLD